PKGERHPSLPFTLFAAAGRICRRLIKRNAVIRKFDGEHQMRRLAQASLALILLVVAIAARSQSSQHFGPVTKSFIAIEAPIIALQHVRIIDGTGAPAVEDQTLIIENGAIREI